jgi:hypothetical protein
LKAFRLVFNRHRQFRFEALPLASLDNGRKTEVLSQFSVRSRTAEANIDRRSNVSQEQRWALAFGL